MVISTGMMEVCSGYLGIHSMLSEITENLDFDLSCRSVCNILCLQESKKRLWISALVNSLVLCLLCLWLNCRNKVRALCVYN